MNTCPSCEPANRRVDAIACMPLAMAYVPWQTLHHTFELNKALQVGTIFPDLCKPFCGRRGNCL